MSAPKIIAQIVLTGAQIFGRAFAEAYRTAAANASRQRNASEPGGAAAGTSNPDGSPASESDRLTRQLGISLDEAAMILNLKKEPLPSRDDVLQKYEHLFKTNDPEKGGSFYLQSKIYRARERLESELMIGMPKEEQQQAQAPGADANAASKKQ